MPKTLGDTDALVALSERSNRLNKLTESPEWQELVRVLKEREDKHVSNLTRKLNRGELLEKDEMLRHIGFWKGVNAVLSAPGAVGKQLETAMKRAQQEGEHERPGN